MDGSITTKSLKAIGLLNANADVGEPHTGARRRRGPLDASRPTRSATAHFRLDTHTSRSTFRIEQQPQPTSSRRTANTRKTDSSAAAWRYRAPSARWHHWRRALDR